MTLRQYRPGGGAGGPTLRGVLASKQLSLLTLTLQNSGFILMMHHSRVMPPAGDHRYSPSAAVFLHELIKLAVSFTLVLYEASKTLAPSTPATVLFEQIYNAVFSGDAWKLVVPAGFHTLQNILQYIAIGNLDAVQFQVLYQLKILTTGIFSVYLLRRPLTLTRWLSLVILTIGVSIVSIPSSSSQSPDALLHGMPVHFFPSFPRSNHELGQDIPISPQAHLTKRSATYQGIDMDMDMDIDDDGSFLTPPQAQMNHSLGISAVLVAAAVSGLTGVYFEKVLKESPTQASLWIRNVQLSFYSMIAALLGGVWWQDGQGIREHGFLEGYSAVVWATVVLQAAGGIIASVVIRDADNIVKNFATSVSIVLSFSMSIYIFDFQASRTFFAGTACVLLASYLYSLPDEAFSQRPSEILRFSSFEKPVIESLLTPSGEIDAVDSMGSKDED